MLSEQDGRMISVNHTRVVVVARLTAEDMYRALLAYRVRESVAAAVAAKLIVIKLVA